MFMFSPTLAILDLSSASTVKLGSPHKPRPSVPRRKPALGQNLLAELRDHLLKLARTSHEIGLAIDFNQHAGLAVAAICAPIRPCFVLRVAFLRRWPYRACATHLRLAMSPLASTRALLHSIIPARSSPGAA